MKLYANNCVWVSRRETVKDAESGKIRRVRRERPEVYAGTVYTVWPLGSDDDLHPFVGWNWHALCSGAAARHYGRPIAVFSDKEKMWEFVKWYESLLNWALEYGNPWCGGSLIQIGWDGVHDESDRGDCKTCELCDHYDCPYTGRSDVWACSGYREAYDPSIDCPLPQAFGNLVWAKVRGLRTRRTDESWALLDLEQITRSDKYDPYVHVVHAYPRDYGNEGVYSTEIIHVCVRARQIIDGKEARV